MTTKEIKDVSTEIVDAGTLVGVTILLIPILFNSIPQYLQLYLQPPNMGEMLDVMYSTFQWQWQWYTRQSNWWPLDIEDTGTGTILNI